MKPALARRMRPAAPQQVAAYKEILRAALAQRPSGMRRRLAQAMGHNQSFVSHMLSDAYATPVPARHLKTIFAVCHLTPAETEAFLKAYLAAHPRRRSQVDRALGMRMVQLRVPDLGSAARNRELDRTLARIARDAAGAAVAGGPGAVHLIRLTGENA